jgi:regulator of sigma E protease
MPLSENGAHTSVLVVRDGKRTLLTDVSKGAYLTEKYDENGNAELDESGAPLMQSASGFGVFLDNQSPRYRFSFFESVGRSVPYSLSTATAILKALGELVTGVLGLKDVGGPISTIDITMQVARSGFINVLYLITLISINLAVFNLLPIPALDGSKIVFTAVEWIRGKPINRTVENYIHLIGLLLLFSFVIIIDVIKLF